MKASTQRTASSVKVGDYASIHFSDKNANSKRKLSSTSPSLSCAFDSFLRNQTNKHTHFLSLSLSFPLSVLSPKQMPCELVVELVSHM